VVEGKVRNIANYGAFIEIEEGIDGLLARQRPLVDQEIGMPSEMLKKGESVRAVSQRRSGEQRLPWASADAGEDPG